MNNFFKYIQPTIVRASFDESLPENVRGRFFINFNVFGIKYFEENYILSENSNNFQYLLLKENSGIFMLEDTLEAEDIVDIPRLYIDITDEFVNDNTNLFKSFIYQASLENSIWAQGIDNFLCGKQYYVNSTLYNYLALTDKLSVADFTCRLPNYLDESGHITRYWIDLSNEPYKDYSNLDYFNERNKLLDNTFSEDELSNFYSTFCKLILKYTQIGDEKKNEGNNKVYDLVLNYFANFKNDSGSDAVSMILGTLYSTSTSQNQKCGCNTTFGETQTYSSQSCYDLYVEAMNTWLTRMLGDKDFYNDWFVIQLGDAEMANDVLISNLVEFINEFLQQNNILSFTTKRKSIACECPNVTASEYDCNSTAIKNYLDVLKFVNDLEISKNKNKIKIYGEQFGTLLPKLQF